MQNHRLQSRYIWSSKFPRRPITVPWAGKCTSCDDTCCLLERDQTPQGSRAATWRQEGENTRIKDLLLQEVAIIQPDISSRLGGSCMVFFHNIFVLSHVNESHFPNYYFKHDCECLALLQVGIESVSNFCHYQLAFSVPSFPWGFFVVVGTLQSYFDYFFTTLQIIQNLL